MGGLTRPEKEPHLQECVQARGDLTTAERKHARAHDGPK